MERVTFHRPDVEKLLSTMVCMKVDVGDGRHPLADKFNVRGLPTLVLMEPGGRVLYNDGGAPPPSGFATFFAVKRYNAAIDAYNRQDWAAAAPHLFFVRKWFATTELGRKADEMVRNLQDEKAFVDAYAKEEAEYATRLEKARAAVRKEKERRASARKLKAEADELYGKYLRTKAYKLYRKIIWEYPDLPEADAAREILREKKQKWKEPER